MIPPDLGVEREVIPGSGKNPTLALGRTRAPRLPVSTMGSRGNLTLDCREHSKFAAEAGDMLADNLPDQSRLVLIGRPFAAPFLIIPFNHEGEIANAH